MKSILVFAATAGLAAFASAQPPQPEVRSEAPARAQTAFDLIVRLPLPQAAALFGPQGERPWAGKHWDPQFLYPQPARDTEGAVFTLRHGPFDAVWVNTAFSLDDRRFQYVYFIPGILVTVIDVRFTPGPDSTTAVHVVYTRTAISPEGNAHVAALAEADKKSGPEWQQAIDGYLASRKPPARP
jgi:hypothetical protein